MEYVDLAQAREMTGLRLVCVKGLPSPWSVAARAIFTLKRVDFVPVAQAGGQDNPELVEWTRHRNAPVAIYNDEAPRVRWLEIVHLAERLGSGPSLIPTDINDRMAMVGLTSEMAEPHGFAWNGRLLMMKMMHDAMGDGALEMPLFKDYGYSVEAASGATTLTREFLQMLSARLEAQKAKGSDYLFGTSLTAADVYWAYFSLLMHPMTPDENPMPDQMRQTWEAIGSIIGDYNPIVIEHRDRVFEKHLTLPIDF